MTDRKTYYCGDNRITDDEVFRNTLTHIHTQGCKQGINAARAEIAFLKGEIESYPDSDGEQSILSQLDERLAKLLKNNNG